ncbi:MAG: hypothetical protein ACOCV1_06570 [Bacillota bacterium]
MNEFLKKVILSNEQVVFSDENSKVQVINYGTAFKLIKFKGENPIWHIDKDNIDSLIESLKIDINKMNDYKVEVV